MKKKWIFLIILLALILFVIYANTDAPEVEEPNTSEEWEEVRRNDIAQTNEEWGEPIYLEVNSQFHEDSPFISLDGNTLYFAVYPGEDLTNDLATGKFKGDIDVFYSEIEEDGQFRTKVMDERFYLSESPWSSAGPMIDSAGNIFYMSNRVDEWVEGMEVDDNIHMNDEKLAFNTGDSFGDPHYCEALDELYFNTMGFFNGNSDNHIYVVRNAMASKFENEPEKLSEPINTRWSLSWQPHLTSDCQTMYFITQRGDTAGKGPGIYKSTRNRDGWNEPEPIVWSKTGVGEPTLTEDGSKLYFVQLFKHRDGSITADLFYVEKK